MSSDHRRRELPRSRASRWVAWTLSIAIVSAPLSLLAQATNKAAAEALLVAGLEAMNAGKLDEACPKLEESLRLYPSLNTGYHLADCWERSGRTASAWIQFVEVAEKAHAAGEAAKEQKARERATALASKVSRLTIRVEAAVTGMTISRDGEMIGSGQWATAVPVDPGEHRIEAAAPGKKPWKTTVIVGKDGVNESVTVPALIDDVEAKKPEPPASTITPPPPPATTTTANTTKLDDSAGNGWQRPVAYVVGGVGLVGIGLGVIFGLGAKSKWSDAEPHCPANVCDDQGHSSWDAARSNARISNIAFAFGGIALATGIVLFVTAPSGSPKNASGTTSGNASGTEARVSIAADPGAFRLVATARF
jgi:hypothetical protein